MYVLQDRTGALEAVLPKSATVSLGRECKALQRRLREATTAMVIGLDAEMEASFVPGSPHML